MIARLIEHHEISPETRHFSFEVPGDGGMDFIPGQFVSFTEHLEGKEVTRAYSISSPPFENRFDLVLNRVPEGRFSPHLFNLEPGATGTGVGPFRSMLMAQLPHDSQNQFTLVLGVRHENGILYREQFEELALQHANFHFLPIVSRSGADWPGLKGHVQPHVMQILGTRRDMHVYICGMKDMVEDMRAQLKAAGLDRRHIIFEKYD